MATRPLPEVAAGSQFSPCIEELRAAAKPDAKLVPFPMSLADTGVPKSAIAKQPEIVAQPAPFQRAPHPPLPDPDDEPTDPRSPLFRNLLVATAGVVMLATIFAVGYRARSPAGDHSIQPATTINHRPISHHPLPVSASPGQIQQPLYTGKTHPPKPSAYGEPLQPRPFHHSRLPLAPPKPDPNKAAQGSTPPATGDR